VAGAVVFFIEKCRVVAVDLSHEQREILLPGLQQKVVVIVHQAVVMDNRVIVSACFAKHFQKLIFVRTAQIHIRTRHTAVDQMMKACKIYTGPTSQNKPFNTGFVILAQHGVQYEIKD